MYYICKKLRNGRVEVLAQFFTIDEARAALSDYPKAYIQYGGIPLAAAGAFK